MKHTPLYQEHMAMGGQMGCFKGYALPSQYLGVEDEHRAVREKSGLFDRSYLTRVLIIGPNAAVAVQRITTNDVSEMQEGDCAYTLICNEKGGIMDDVVVYKWNETTYGMTIHPQNRAKILQHLKDHGLPGAKVMDLTEKTAQITLQGPHSKHILSCICQQLPEKPYRCKETEVVGRRCFVASVGFSGESAYEIFCMADAAASLWREILDASDEDEPIPCGTEAWQSLLLEAGVPVYGRELTEEITPFEAGLGCFVRPLQGEFVGRRALDQQVLQGVPRKLIGLVMEGDETPQPGAVVYDYGAPCGRVTSACLALYLQQGVAMALVNRSFLEEREHAFTVETDRGKQACEMVKLPFYKTVQRY